MVSTASPPEAAEVRQPTPRNTLRCRACHTALVEIVYHERRAILRWLVPCETDQVAHETRVPCPGCGEVRVVTHR